MSTDQGCPQNVVHIHTRTHTYNLKMLSPCGCGLTVGIIRDYLVIVHDCSEVIANGDDMSD